MEKRKKLIGVVIAVTLAVSLAIGILPYPSMQEGQATFKSSISDVYAASDYGDTYISGLTFYDETDTGVISFDGDGQVAEREEGDQLERVTALVYIDTDYASTTTEASQNTRVSVKITNPDNTVVFDQVLDTAKNVTMYAGYYTVYYEDTDLSITLDNGEYTVETEYEIYN